MHGLHPALHHQAKASRYWYTRKLHYVQNYPKFHLSEPPKNQYS